MRWTVVALLVLFSIRLFAQKADLRFHHISNGLSQNTITSIVQDSQGFMWFGTRHGLNRYDGRRFISYKQSADNNSLNSSSILSMIVDNKGDLWVGTYGGGLSHYLYSEDEFKSYVNIENASNSLSDNHVSAIYQDSENNIWAGTENGGLNKLISESGQFKRFLSNIDDPLSITDNHVTAISEDKFGNLWVGTRKQGLCLLDKRGDRFISYKSDNRENALVSNSIRSLHLAKSGRFWVGTHNGVQEVVYDPMGRYIFKNVEVNDSRLKEKLDKALILSIYEDSQQRLWIGTENDGLYIVNLKINKIEHYSHDIQDRQSLSNNSIWAINEDATGTIWMGTYRKGINKVDPFEQKFDPVVQSRIEGKGLNYGLVSSFLEDQQGNLWIGTDGGGLNVINHSTGLFEYYVYDPSDPTSLSSNAVTSMVKDDKDNLWIGTWEGGISIKAYNSEHFETIVSNAQDTQTLSGNDIYSLYKDANSFIWATTSRDGLNVIDPETKICKRFAPGNGDNTITSNSIRTIMQDSKGFYWSGNEHEGLDKFRLNEDMEIVEMQNFRHIPGDTASIGQNSITCILEDTKGNIWVGTEGGGLNRVLGDGKFEVINESDGLSDNVVYKILEDLEGYLWISTGQGLNKYNTVTKEMESFALVDGLQSSEFYHSSGYKADNGELFFGGINGYNRFNPSQVQQKNKNIPPVHITLFHESDQREDKNQVLKTNSFTNKIVKLKHYQNDFNFEFTALNYSQAEKNQYAYQLKNYDNDWQYAGTRNTAFYTNVPPGEYTFKVKASNNDELWNQEGSSITIVIGSPWYATYWAYMIYASLIVAAFMWYRQNLIHRERLKSELQLEHVELTKMQELDVVKSRFFANISHEFRTPLTLIIGPLKSLYLDESNNENRKQIKMMLRNAQRLLRLINQILDLSKLESGSVKLEASKYDIAKFLNPIAYSFVNYADRQCINYKISMPEKPILVYFERDKLEKVFINLLSNAFKYTPEFGHVNLSIDTDDKSVKVMIADTGIGIQKNQLDLIFNRYYRGLNDESKGTGIGLALTKELIELHKGEVEVDSEPNRGTTFTVKLPLGTDHLENDEILNENIDFEFSQDPMMELEEMSVNSISEEEPVGTSYAQNSLPLILIAEDNAEIRSFIIDFLETNYHIIEVTNGKEALEVAKDQIPDLIITDIMMPELNGYELCDALANDEKTSHIPIIILTAKASNNSMEKGFETGASYYVTKPFNPKLLELRIKNILNSRKLFKEQVLHNKTVNLNPNRVVITSADETFLRRAMACVEENMSNTDFQIEDLCKAMGLSRIQLYRKFKGLIGQSANEFIRSVRLKRAAQLIRQEQLTIAEITYKVGFNDLQYFRNCFKKQFGVKPSEYLQQSRETDS